jgi:replicative DNA helicase
MSAGIAIVASVQLEEGEGSPAIADLGQNAPYGQAADALILLSRKGRAAAAEVAKNRFGSLGSVGLSFDPDCSRFAEP